MTTTDKIIVLQQQIIDNNWELIRLLQKLSPEDQKIYAPQVEAMIAKTITNDNNKPGQTNH